MRKKAKTQQQLHLVTAEQASALSQTELSPAADEDAFLASGVRRYNQLRQEADRELFGKQDPERLGTLWSELNVLRERLAAYGIQMRA
jgi:hypothetical protein